VRQIFVGDGVDETTRDREQEGKKKRLRRSLKVNGMWMQERWGVGPEEGQGSWFDNLLIEKEISRAAGQNGKAGRDLKTIDWSR
jgi:hypothetical protein